MGAVLHTGCQKWGVWGGKSCKAALMMPEFGWWLCCECFLCSNLRVNGYGIENTHCVQLHCSALGLFLLFIWWRQSLKGVCYIQVDQIGFPIWLAQDFILVRGGQRLLPTTALLAAMRRTVYRNSCQSQSGIKPKHLFQPEKPSGLFFHSSLNMKRLLGSEKTASMLISRAAAIAATCHSVFSLVVFFGFPKHRGANRFFLLYLLIHKRCWLAMESTESFFSPSENNFFFTGWTFKKKPPTSSRLNALQQLVQRLRFHLSVNRIFWMFLIKKTKIK